MKRVLWDVDTQVDFVLPDGKLALRDAPQAIPAMSQIVEAARTAGIPHVASADDHELTDAEISATPDYRATYPPHCLRGTPGAAKIAETAQLDPVPLALTDVPERWITGREFLLLKKQFDVFTNPNTDRLLALLDPEEVILFGVAIDVCDDATIKGLLARDRKVVFVEDASCGLDDERTQACLVDWRMRGVRLAAAEQVIAGL